MVRSQVAQPEKETVRLGQGVSRAALHTLRRPLASQTNSAELVQKGTEVTECELWEGDVGTHGYGVVQVNGDQQLAHRVAYERHVGPIPSGHEVMHLCERPLCVRPDHLLAGTHEENMFFIRKSACINGHPQPETGRDKNGGCKACRRDRERERKRAAAQRYRTKRYTNSTLAFHNVPEL